MDSVPLIHHDPARPATDLRGEIERWISSVPFRAVVNAFDGDFIGTSGSLADRLRALAEFSDRWDYRAGQERNLATTETFDDHLATLIVTAAKALGMVDSTPFADRYDHVLVLGGLIRACFVRPDLAATLISDGLKTGTVTGIGAFRPLRGDEEEIATAIGHPGLRDEFTAMVQGMRDAFSLGDPVEVHGNTAEDNENLRWRVETFRTKSDLSVTVVSAPTTDATRRANTPDSYKYFAEQLAHLSPGDSLLAVTSAIYVPFQHVHAIRQLGIPYRVGVDMVGVAGSHARADVLAQTFTPANYLQEIRSMILALRTLESEIGSDG